MSKAEKLSFSVEGKFITDLAREKFYYGFDFVGAIELLMSCLETDEFSEGDRLMIAFKILNGQAELKGTYPGDDYGVRDLDEKNPRYDIGSKLKAVAEEVEELKREKNTLVSQLCCIAEELDDWRMQAINRAWMRDYDGDAPIFSDVEPLPRTSSELMTESMSNAVSDFIENMTRSPDQTKHPDYGFLEPNGTFHNVDFAEHMSYAYDKLREMCGGMENEEYWKWGDDPEGFLFSRGWVLIHNPYRGTGKVSRDETRRLTKSQREFLFDYYTERGKPDLAKKALEDE